MRLSVRQEKDRDSGKDVVNFDAYMHTKEDVDQAMKVLAVTRELLPADIEVTE